MIAGPGMNQTDAKAQDQLAMAAVGRQFTELAVKNEQYRADLEKVVAVANEQYARAEALEVELAALKGEAAEDENQKENGEEA